MQLNYSENSSTGEKIISYTDKQRKTCKCLADIEKAFSGAVILNQCAAKF